MGVRWQQDCVCELREKGRAQKLRKMRLCRLCFLAVIGLAASCLASVSPSNLAFFPERRLQVWSAFHYSPVVPRTREDASCEVSKPPLALATPDPLFDAAEADGKVAVSFIVGTDGRVHSPVILGSSGPVEERRVLEAVQTWRYRPAMCNAVPAEVESRIEFSAR